MTTLIAQVTILRNGGGGPLMSDNGSAMFAAWNKPVVVSPGETFDETDAAEVVRLVEMGAARFQ